MRRLAACSLALALLAGGCGLGEGDEERGGATIRVTRDFGKQRVGTMRVRQVREGDTVMRALRSRFEVKTRFGGRFVQAIDGVAGKGPEGRRDWFYFVNGSEASVGAAEYDLSPGDVVQWDYRRWDGAMRVPAIVGAFPEPFKGGLESKRLPVRVECDDAKSPPCREAKRRLRRAGIRASGASLGTSGAEKVLRVVVARWPGARLVRATAALEQGPGQSGVFARFAAGGGTRRLHLLGPNGEVVRQAPPGTGLVAALSPREDQLIWLVTALDRRGLMAAARALASRVLRDAYAVAATPRGPESLPVGSGR